MTQKKKSARISSHDAHEKKPAEEFPSGIGDPLAFDAPGFVEEMHARVNLHAVGKALLDSEDLKIKQRAWEYLLEMKYGRGAPVAAEEVPRVDVELPRPE